MFDLKNLCRRILQVDILPKEEFETFNKWMMTSTTETMPNVLMTSTPRGDHGDSKTTTPDPELEDIYLRTDDKSRSAPLQSERRPSAPLPPEEQSSQSDGKTPSSPSVEGPLTLPRFTGLNPAERGRQT